MDIVANKDTLVAKWRMKEDNWRMTVAAITAMLGGRKTLKRNVTSDNELRVITREGLPVTTFSSLAGQLNVERKVLAKVVGISDRTLSRRLAAESRLSADESDRTMRVARVFALAKDVLGDVDKASRWMSSWNLALGGETPLGLLDTDAGRHDVESVLRRIEYGIYS